MQPPKKLTTKWTGVRDATTPGSPCIQVNIITKSVMGQEDCLFLNVFTPKLGLDEETKLPVFVWIHPGNFYFEYVFIDMVNS